MVLGADFPNFLSNFTRSGMKLNAGYFLADNFSVGANFGVRRRSLLDLDKNRFGGVAFDASVFARYYFPKPSDKLRIFLQGEGGLDKTWAGELEERYEFVTAGGGLTFFISENLSLDLTSKLRLSNRNDEMNLESPGWGLGFRYYLPEKKAE